jgi:sigma-E factor negative regulatory protein RseA
MGGTKQEEDALGVIGEPLRDMVSALVDGEASEFETRRVLEQAGDPAVRALIGRHYAVRSVLRREAEVLCPPGLSRSILAALEAEPLPQGAVVQAPRWRGWAGGAAVAASVCLVAVLGTRAVLQPEAGSAPQVAAGAVSLGTLGQPAVTPVAMNTAQATVGLRPPLVDDADGEARKRLQMYMMPHAGNAALNTPEGMMPYARVVSFDEP